MIDNSKTWLWAAILIASGLAIYAVSNILLPFIVGTFVAYALNPAVNKLEKWKISRGLATPLLILSFFTLIGGLLFFAIPFLKSELTDLAKLIPFYARKTLDTLQPHMDKLSHYVDTKDFSQLQETATSHIGDMLSWGLNLLARVLTNSLAIANLISLIILTPIISFYMLRDWPHIIQAIARILPRSQLPMIVEQARKINQVLGAYIRGQATVCFILMIIYTTGLSLVGLNFSLIIGIVTGLLSFIPYFGVLIGVAAGMGIALSQFPDWFSIGMVAGVFLTGQIIEGYFLTPKLVGDSIGLHPVWLIFSLLAGGSLFGFIGIVLALPLAAVVGVVVRCFLSLYMNSPLYLGGPFTNHKLPTTKESL
ncbi:MAG: AI-2E family transporter [Alphaproteobacteria bacterium]|nr:AI-2E family transporter [Alphaproteobacteria bacterium]